MTQPPSHFCGFCEPPKEFPTHEALVEHHRAAHPNQPWSGMPETADDLPGGSSEE